jgi:serine O-acetyltransferase
MSTSPVAHNGLDGHNDHEEAPDAMPGPPSLRAALRGDLEQMARVKETHYPSLGGLIDVLTIPGTWAVILFRLASTAHNSGLRPLSRFLFFLNVVLFGSELHPGAIVQPGLVILHSVGVGLGGGCRLGHRVQLFRGAAMGGAGTPKRPGQPTLGNDVILLDGARVFGPAHVGDRSSLGAGALVVDDVAPDMFVYGSSKSDRIRPLAEIGLGERAESELGYGAAARRAELRGPVPTGRRNGHRRTQPV